MNDKIIIKDRISKERKVNPSDNYKKVKLNKNMVKDDNFVWILKATGFNRGNGIHLFKDIE